MIFIGSRDHFRVSERSGKDGRNLKIPVKKERKMKEMIFTEKVPVRGKYDVIVAGGGVAGIAAALSARRAGKRVLLIEKTITPGGLATIGLVNFFVPMCNGRGTVIIKGMAEEFLRLSIKYGFDTIPECWKNGTADEKSPRYKTHYSPQIFALALTEIMTEEGVDLRYDSIVANVDMQQGENGMHCNGVYVESKSGREFFEAGIVIDATGDADVLFRAGVPTVQGKNYFSCFAKLLTLDSCEEAVKEKNIRACYRMCSGGCSTLYGHNHPEGMKFFTGTSAEDVTEFTILNQIEMLKKLKNDDRNSREVITLPTMPDYRTTRRIDGDITLREEDAYRHFEDSVGAICDFDRRDFLYEIPYGCMVRSGFDNLITAGRTTAGEGYAWDILRVIPPAILSGQAAGVAAAQALDGKRPICDVDIALLQKTLAGQDVMIHFDDSLIPEKANLSSEKVDTGHL